VKTGSIYVKVTARIIKPSELEDRITHLEGVTQQNANTITQKMVPLKNILKKKMHSLLRIPI